MLARACTLILLLSTSAFSVVAQAAEARFERVSLLSAPDRVSLVFELTAEPVNVATRRVSAAVLELDAGPVAVPARATSFVAPPGVRFVMGVSLEGGDGTAGHLKARITLLERAHSAVRVVGHRVYVDFSPESLPPAVRAGRPAGGANPSATAAVAPRPTPAIDSAAAVASSRDVYRATIQPALDRLEQLTPFLLSATASPSESVLKAVGSTLVGIQGLLLSVDVPADAHRAHEAVSSAVAAAVTAVNPGFNGDRAVQAKQALGLLEQAKAQLAN